MSANVSSVPNNHHNQHENRHIMNLHNLNKLVQETAARVAESNVVNIPTQKESKKVQSKITIYTRRKLTSSNYAAIFGAIGLFLMVLDNEFIIAQVYSLGSLGSYIVKGLISFTTFLLLISLCFYYFIEYKIRNWPDGLTMDQLFNLVIELVICAIHPIPGAFRFRWAIRPLQGGIEGPEIVVMYRIDVILSLIMVARFYLFLRTYLLHKKMFHGKFIVIGNFQAVNFDIGFKIKTLMTFFPGRVLCVFTSFLFVSTSWYLRLTEREFDMKFNDLANCFWCVAVTFLTIGYGDLTPVTFLGRTILISTGFMGIASSALIIAVIAQKLSLSKAESLVHTYISNDKLKTHSKTAAAIVIQKAWLTYKYGRLQNRRYHMLISRRALYESIRYFQRVKLEQRKQAINEENQIDNKQKSLLELQRDLFDMVLEIKKSQETYETKLKDLDSTLVVLRSVSYQNKQIMERLNIIADSSTTSIDTTVTSGIRTIQNV